MSHESSRRTSIVGAPANIPNAPPLPAAPRPLQRARDAAYRFIGYPPSRPASAQGDARDWITSGRLASLGYGNATTTHKTGLEINTIAINESGTHALLGGREIFKTVKVENGVCVEDLNLRSAVRSTPNQASGRPRQTYSIDIADVAWAKGDCGHYVAAATSSGKIILYDLGHAGLQSAQLHEHFRQVHKVTFNPHRGNLLLSGSQDGTVRLWDVRDARNEARSLQSKRKYSGQSDGVRDVKWSPTEGVDFAIGTESGFIQRWDLRNLKTAKVKIPAHALSCNIIDWHPDGTHIASASSDKTVRVWDFSANRKGKAAWEIKAPYPVLNARWRPAWYDREHPEVHVWDLRRPALPFRELMPFNEVVSNASAPTDLLWHSQDLLWTVGREGVFMQSDIQHAQKVIDKRNLQSFAVSPTGEVNFVVQKRRQQRRAPKLLPPTTKTSASAHSDNNTTHSTSPETIFISRSWQDDSLDHSFLSIRPNKHNQRSNSGIKTMSGLPPQILALDQILHNRMSFAPQQQMVQGILPYHADAEVFRYIAEKFPHDRIPETATDEEKLAQATPLLERIHDVAEIAGQYKLAQTWKIVGFAATTHLKARISATSGGAGSGREGMEGRRAGVQRGGETGGEAVDVEEGGPFTVVEMLNELIQHHAEKADAQTASQMIITLAPLLPLTHSLPNDVAERHLLVQRESLASVAFLAEEIEPIIDEHIKPLILKGLQPLQIESILSTYHEQLIKHRLFVEATHLRKICYPAFPSVYEHYMTDNHVYLKCSECGKPVESGMEKLKCESCNTKMAPCPYCREATSPFGGGSMMTACLKCNHSMHMGCSQEWFGKNEGDGCAVEGCLCNCGE